MQGLEYSNIVVNCIKALKNRENIILFALHLPVGVMDLLKPVKITEMFKCLKQNRIMLISDDDSVGIMKRFNPELKKR